MKIFIDIDQELADAISLTSHYGCELVEQPEDADFAITDAPDAYDDAGIPVVGIETIDISNTIKLDGIGRVKLLDNSCRENTLYAETIQVKSDRVSFSVNGANYAKKDFDINDDGDITISLVVGGEKKLVHLKLGRTCGIVIPVNRDREGYGTNQTSSAKKVSVVKDEPIASNDLGSMAMDLLDDVNDDELSGKAINESVLGTTTSAVTSESSEPPKEVNHVSEIDSEEDLHLYSSGLMG